MTELELMLQKAESKEQEFLKSYQTTLKNIAYLHEVELKQISKNYQESLEKIKNDLLEQNKKELENIKSDLMQSLEKQLQNLKNNLF